MARQLIHGTFTIASGAQESNIIQGPALGNLVAILFYNPAAFTGAIAVEVASKDDALAAAHAALYSGGSAVVLTAARIERHEINGFQSVMLDADTNQAAERVVGFVGVLDI